MHKRGSPLQNIDSLQDESEILTGVAENSGYISCADLLPLSASLDSMASL